MAEFEAESQDYLIKIVQSARYCGNGRCCTATPTP